MDFRSYNYGLHFVFQFFEQLFLIVAVKHVEGVEGDDAAVGVGDVDAGFFDGADVEIVGVEELHDDDAEDLVIGRRGGSQRSADPGDAAE